MTGVNKTKKKKKHHTHTGLGSYNNIVDLHSNQLLKRKNSACGVDNRSDKNKTVNGD